MIERIVSAYSAFKNSFEKEENNMIALQLSYIRLIKSFCFIFAVNGKLTGFDAVYITNTEIFL